jgi:hypothetical protein
MTAANHPSTTVIQDRSHASSDLLVLMRTEMKRLLNRLMSDDCDDQIQASLPEKSTSREMHRNGCRVRRFETQLGAIGVADSQTALGELFL